MYACSNTLLPPQGDHSTQSSLQKVVLTYPDTGSFLKDISLPMEPSLFIDTQLCEGSFTLDWSVLEE